MAAYKQAPAPIGILETELGEAMRREAYALTQNEAIRLAQLAASEGEDDPGDDFEPASATGQFVFSAPRSPPCFGRPQAPRPLLESQQAPPNGPESRLKMQI